MNSSKRFKYLRNNGTFSEVYSVDNQPPYPVTPNGTYPSMTVGNATNASKCDSITLRQVARGLDVPLVKGVSFNLTNANLDLNDYVILYCKTDMHNVTENYQFQIICNRVTLDGAPIIQFCGSGVCSLIGKMQFYVDFKIIGSDLNNPTLLFYYPIYVTFDPNLSLLVQETSNSYKVTGVDILKIN